MHLAGAAAVAAAGRGGAAATTAAITAAGAEAAGAGAAAGAAISTMQKCAQFHQSRQNGVDKKRSTRWGRVYATNSNGRLDSMLLYRMDSRFPLYYTMPPTFSFTSIQAHTHISIQPLPCTAHSGSRATPRPLSPLQPLRWDTLSMPAGAVC